MIDWQDINSWQVLVVDDEPDNLEVVAETLEYLGAQVKTALNGQEALEALEAFMANLILTDLSMPVMDGWQMRANAKRNPAFAEVPIMALSAHAIVGDRERAIEAGFNGYITKPVNMNTLLDDIRSALVVPETKGVEDKAI